jgi:transposase
MLQQNVYLRVNRRQFKGDRCQKPFGEELNFVKKTRTSIEEVSIDLWSASKNLVQDLMPNAEVVADRFHGAHLAVRGGQSRIWK